MDPPTCYRTTPIDGLSIFYRDAEPYGAPTLLVRHGFPSSSHMFALLFTRLADRFHAGAPDCPATDTAAGRILNGGMPVCTASSVRT